MQLGQLENSQPVAATSSHPSPSSTTNTASSSSAEGLQRQEPQEQLQPLSSGVAALTPRQAFFADTEAVPLHAAAGRVSAELLCPYPPGVPVVFPGEAFSTSSIQALQDTLAGGGVVTGGHDSTLQTVWVVVQPS